MIVSIVLAALFWFWSFLLLVMYGDENLEEMADPNGPCSVGIKRFWSQEDQHVICFYPITKRKFHREQKADYLLFGEAEAKAGSLAMHSMEAGDEAANKIDLNEMPANLKDATMKFNAQEHAPYDLKQDFLTPVILQHGILDTAKGMST